MVDTMKMSKDEYQDHMDMLAKKVGKVLDGQRIEDGISACAACIGFGMVQLAPSQHGKMRDHIGIIIDAIIKNVPPPKATPDEKEDAELAGNMRKINSIMHMLEGGLITREQCRQRLMDECHVADHNIDMLLNAYDSKANN